MSRKRSSQKTKKTHKKNYTKSILVLFIIIILAVSSIAAVIYNPPDNSNSNNNDNNSSPKTYDKWLFAMDTDNVQSKFQASAIPTLLIINKKGEYIFYSQGYNQKQQLDPYIDLALEGNAESYGEVPDFTLKTFNNEKFTLSEYIGKVVIIDIMGVGRTPCVKQMPELQKIKKERKDDITILSVDVYYSGETKQDVIDTYGEYILI